MDGTSRPADRDAIEQLLRLYFDGLFHCDIQRLKRALHPDAFYATASGGELLTLRMEQYWPVVAARVSPASKGEARRDRILSIDFHGSETAQAIVECTMAPRHFTDLLALVRLDGRWWIISKVFHFDEQPRARG